MKARNICLLLCALFSYSQCNPINLDDEKKPFTIEESVLGYLSVTSFSGKWISDNEIEYLDKTSKDVKLYNVAKNQTEVILKNSILQKYNTTKYEFSADRKFVLLTYDEQAIYRHSKKAKFVVYSIKDGKYYGNDDYVQAVEWSPKNSAIVFVKDNDLYLIRNITTKVEATRITNDGKSGTVFNGISDWVYEEEILSSGKAFWFSPDGEQLTFVTFFDTNVKKATILEYGEPGSLKDQYTNEVHISYPKAGCTNPTYELRHVFLNNIRNITVLTKFAPGKEIFYNLKWVKNNNVLYVQTNRVQNESTLSLCEISPRIECRMLSQEKNPKGWANTYLPIIDEKVSKYLRIEGESVGQSGKFKHLVVYNIKDSNFTLTNGVSEVLKVLHWDENKKTVYYLGVGEKSAPSTHVYAIGESKGSKSVCLTCGIKSIEGRACEDSSASFSKNSSYVIIDCNGPDPKTVYLFKNTQPLGKPLAILEDNTKLRGQLAKKIMPEVMNLTVDVPGPFKADVRLLLPPNMDRSGKTKYPLVIYVYAGPASKNINDAFKPDWAYYMTTNLSIIYGMIDGRNTLRKGENMLFAGYRALGTLEMEDQINVTRSLQKMLPFIDSLRTGIWGWSYGGYATTKVLEIDTRNVFKCGVAVAPVADWIYYNSMYTERYMGLPQENKKGYEGSSVLKDVSNLRNKQYFLIHGNADDNVHYQNAMMIAKLLEKNNIPFELMDTVAGKCFCLTSLTKPALKSYPDEDHSLCHVRKHLYYTMSRFWKKCFNLQQ